MQLWLQMSIDFGSYTLFFTVREGPRTTIKAKKLCTSLINSLTRCLVAATGKGSFTQVRACNV